MSRIEVNGIYKHAPLTNAQMATTKRNLDREVVIMRDAVTDRATLIPPVTDPTTDASAYPTNYIYAMDYDSTDDGGDNPNIRRHIPTLELLGSVGDDTAGSNWISIQTNAEGTYNYLSGGETLQAALEALDTQLAGSTLKYISDSSTIGSITTSSGTGVPTNTNSGGDYQITLGVGHTLTSSSNSSILGGFNNEISFSNYSFVGGGSTNYIRTTISRDTYSVIAGGLSNYIDGYYATYSFIGSGESNNIGGDHSVITGGKNNSISDIYNFIGGGEDNSIAGESSYSAVICGDTNSIANTSLNSFVGGGSTNAISIANNSAILAGNLNKLDNSTNSVIVAGFTNYIYNGSHISFIGSGQYNYIYQGDSNVICGGGYNQIYASTDIAFIGGGVRNKIFDASNGSVIVGGTGNLIYEGSSNCFVGGGYNNYIYGNSNQSSIFGGLENTIREGSTLSAIIGGANNHIIGTVTSSFILGSNINTASYARSYTTFMNRVFLWENAFELKDKPFNVGDVLMVESDVGGVPYVTWGAAPSTNTYSGLDPIATSAGTYSVKSQGQSIILTSYIAINNAESGSGAETSTSGMVGTDFTNDGYTFTNYTAISYNTIYGDATGISSQNGLEILDGFAYDIKVKNVNLSWKGPYMKNAPSLAFAYSGGITVTRDGSTRTIEMGDLPTVNVTGTTNAGAYDPSPIYNGYGSSDSADTASPYLFLRYNATTNQVNLGIAQLYIHQKYVYKAYTVYDSVSTDSFFTITWPTGSYALPSIGSTFYFWTSNPATNSSLGSYTVANVVGNDVTVNSNFGNVTNGPCWIFVPGKLPYLTATFDLDITKTAV